jgi:8-hydroxy-5-deazaflavin:NADPH oxidoreductase
MKISIIGTGSVGQTIAAKLVELGHDVVIGTRNVAEKLASTATDSYGTPPFSQWHKGNSKVRLDTFANAAAFGEIIVNATHGGSSIDALKLAGEKNLAGKILIDIANPLDFSKGMPPSLLSGLNNTHSLGEEIQKTFPLALVVKTFNTMWCGLMVNPGMIGGGNHLNFIAGNDLGAKKKVTALLKEIGWKDESLFDLGDITAARATESLLPVWVRIMGTLNSPAFNFGLVR